MSKLNRIGYLSVSSRALHDTSTGSSGQSAGRCMVRQTKDPSYNSASESIIFGNVVHVQIKSNRVLNLSVSNRALHDTSSGQSAGRCMVRQTRNLRYNSACESILFGNHKFTP
jgi:hypothetical protein